MSETPEPLALREAAAAIALDLSDLAKAIDDLQPLMGMLVLRAGLSTDEATLKQAQLIDRVSQQLHHYAALMSQLTTPAPAPLALKRWTAQTATADSGECEFF